MTFRESGQTRPPSTQGPIGVFDSGVGGLSIWQEIVRELPHEDILYVADQAHMPYGARSLNEVRILSEAIAGFLLDQGAKIIVIACNTASAASLSWLRQCFPDTPFVGMEPAVKPAVERTRTGVVGVLATEATFQGELFANLLAMYGNNAQVIPQVGKGLAQAVESGDLDSKETEQLLAECLNPVLQAGADQLVLGCTHYPFLRPCMERFLGSTISIIDPAPAIAAQTRRVLERHGLIGREQASGRRSFLTSGDPESFSKMIQNLVPHHVTDTRVEMIHWTNSGPSKLSGKYLAYSNPNVPKGRAK